MVQYRFEYKYEAGYHTVTSPDIKGLHVAVKSADKLNDELNHALNFALKLQKNSRPLVPTMIEYAEIA